MGLAQRNNTVTQVTGEARTCNPLIWSQALYHRGTLLPLHKLITCQLITCICQLQILNLSIGENLCDSWSVWNRGIRCGVQIQMTLAVGGTLNTSTIV